MDTLIWVIILATIAIIYFLSHAIVSINNSIYTLRDQMAGLVDKLGQIADALTDKEEAKKLTSGERQELKKRYIKLLVILGKTEQQAKKEAEDYFEEAEFEETHNDYPMKFDQLYKWVIAQEIENRKQNKYGHLLGKFRDYLKDKTTIPAYRTTEMANDLNTDSEAIYWLIEKMLQEKRLKKVEEYRDDYNQLKHYEVL